MRHERQRGKNGQKWFGAWWETRPTMRPAGNSRAMAIGDQQQGEGVLEIWCWDESWNSSRAYAQSGLMTGSSMVERMAWMADPC